jgi:hypothetical protein
MIQPLVPRLTRCLSIHHLPDKRWIFEGFYSGSRDDLPVGTPGGPSRLSSAWKSQKIRMRLGGSPNMFDARDHREPRPFARPSIYANQDQGVRKSIGCMIGYSLMPLFTVGVAEILAAHRLELILTG